MVDRWAIELAFFELLIACVVYAFVAHKQLSQFRNKTVLQPLKWLLLASVVLLTFASLPLMFVYANALWIHIHAPWIVYAAVIANASSKVLVAVTLLAIYYFRFEDE